MSKATDAMVRALQAWDTTVLPTSRDGMMFEAMEGLREALKDAQATGYVECKAEKMSVVMGIDPGTSTGIAHYKDGKLALLVTLRPENIARYIAVQVPDRVIFEDSRLQSKVWTPVKGAAALKVARNIGEIDAWCKLITAVCADMGIPSHGISPKQKGAKLNAAQFAALTGWTADSNEHTRDAAHVAWPYRSAK